MANVDYQNLLKRVIDSTPKKEISDDRFKLPKAEVFYEGNPPEPWKYLECEFSSTRIHLLFGMENPKIRNVEFDKQTLMIIYLGEENPNEVKENRFYVRTSRHTVPSLKRFEFGTFKEAKNFADKIMNDTAKYWNKHKFESKDGKKY